MRTWSLVPAVLLVAAARAAAQVPAGFEFQVNVSTTGHQTPGDVAIAPSGDFHVIWESRPPSEGHVIARGYDARGVPRGSEFWLSPAVGAHVFPSLDVDLRGNFTVTWSATFPLPPGIRGRRFDPAGRPIGPEFLVSTFAGGPALALQPHGGFVVVGNDRVLGDTDDLGIWARLFGPDGSPQGAEFLVNGYTTSMQDHPSVAADGLGRFVVVWDSNRQDGSGYGVYARRYDRAGAPLGPEFRVNSFTTNNQMFASVGAAEDGRFVVAWASFLQEGAEWEVYAQRYGADGVPAGGEFRVNGTTLSTQFGPHVAMAEAGRFAIAWTSWFQDGSGYGAFAQRFEADGSRIGGEFRLNTYTAGDQWAFMVSDRVGNLFASFLSYGQDGSGGGVFGQRFGGLMPAAMTVDTDGNRVLEPGEAVDVRPAWRNVNGLAQTFSASSALYASGLPATLTDAVGNYGTVADGAIGGCADCYGLTVSDPSPRPATHLDVSMLETLTPIEQGQQKIWRIHVARSFADVPAANPFYRFVEAMLHHGVTGGCSTTTYCPALPTTRAQMAVFTLVARDGIANVPPACATPVFADVPASSRFCPWIEELARRGVAGGCGGGNYCPSASVSREQMAVFVLRTLDPTLSPPACTPPNLFADVPETSPFCRWVEELANRGIVSGCGAGNYCPTASVTREQMGVFISLTFGLTLYGV